MDAVLYTYSVFLSFSPYIFKNVPCIQGSHRMAKTSPYFENLCYGSMVINNKEWKITDTGIEPKVFKIVLAHCYERDLLDDNIETILQVHKLADCYLMDALKLQCLQYLQDSLIRNKYTDSQYILEWSTLYGFSDIEERVFEILSLKLNIINIENMDNNLALTNEDIYKTISNLLLNLTPRSHKKFLGKCGHLDVLIFEKSWRHPEEVLSDKVLLSLLESSSCKTACENDEPVLKGCVSHKTLKQYMNMKRKGRDQNSIWEEFQPSLSLSLVDDLHSVSLYECFKEEAYDELWINSSLHIPCNTLGLKMVK